MYVDDIVITVSPLASFSSLLAALQHEFAMKDLEGPLHLALKFSLVMMGFCQFQSFTFMIF